MNHLHIEPADNPYKSYCHLNVEHVVLFDPFSFAVKIVPHDDSLFLRIYRYL